MQRRQLKLARAIEPAEDEVRGRGDLPLVDLRRDAAAVVLERDLPDQEGEQREDQPDREGLGTELDARGHAETMKTVVPIRTWLKSHSASEMCMRMQPCEAE